MTDLKKFKETMLSKEKFHSLLTGKKLMIQGMRQVFKLCDRFHISTQKIYHDFF